MRVDTGKLRPGGGQNLHTHTKYCDGKQSPEEMVVAAIAKGCGSLGFSGHSYVPFDLKYSMHPDSMGGYLQEIAALKEKYEGTIEIFTGLELDYYTGETPEGLDFTIGAMHYVTSADSHKPVDAGSRDQKEMVVNVFGGDYYAFAEEYYSDLPKITEKANPDIIGHFDLIAKYNKNGELFDEMHPRYVKAALGAMEGILERCRIFEVNTGAMYRLKKPEPYPSVFLLKELCKRGGEVILSSDSHEAESICYKFDEMQDLLKTCGFRYIKRLTKQGFIDVPL